MKETVKTLTTIIGIGITFLGMAWLVVLLLLLVTWFGGII